MVLNRAVRGLTTITLVFVGSLEGEFVRESLFLANKRDVRCHVVKFIKARSEVVEK
jgi:hypothetical protein